ncbi:MAG: efflux RND transporter permease subunit [Candidatus Ozemobacteraceae bacterium]
MNLSEICIKRPVFTVMLMSALVVLGFFSYRSLGLDQYPKINFPMARIYATLPGASPEELETQVAKPIEEAVNALGGVDQITTKCTFGTVQIMVRFVMEKDIDNAAQEVRDKISQIQNNFPQGMDLPKVEKLDPDASSVITFIISGKMGLRELTHFVKKRIKEPLEALNGIGSLQIIGGREREIHVELDAKKLASYNVSPAQVKAAILAQNIEIPGGNVTKDGREFILRTLGRIDSPAEFGEIVVNTLNGVPIHISDIGTVLDSEEEPRTLARLDGKNCLSLGILKQSGANTVEVTNSIQARLEELKTTFPEDMTIVPIRDQSRFIKNTLHELNLHLVLGAIMASVVVLLFMGNVVSTFIAALAIPISLIATFCLIKLMGFTMNNMSMMGLTLAVGIVIDDAIVVLENIFRHIEENKSDSVKAAIEGTSEIYMAVMATSLSLAVIFVPVAFMEGIIGRFLNNFGLTIAFSILISIVVSLTLTPMLCSRFFKYKIARGSGHSKSSAFYSIIDRIYSFFLLFSMNHRFIIVLAAILCMLSIFPIGKFIKIDFVPSDDTNEYSVFFRADEGSSLQGTEKVLGEIEEKIRKLPGIVHTFSTIGEGQGVGVNEGSIFIQLVDIKDRKFTMFDSMTDARKIMSEYNQYRPSVQVSGGFGGGKEWDVNLAIKGPNLTKIKEFSDAVRKKIKDSPSVSNSDTSFIDRKPEIQVKVDRKRAYRMGIDLGVVASALRTVVGGADDINQYKEDDEMYEVRVRMRPEHRQDTQAIADLLFSNSSGSMIRLDSIASITEGVGPAQIDRQDRQRSIMVYANLAPKGAMSDVNQLMEKTIRELKMPPEYSYSFLGKSSDLNKTINGFITAFFMSTIFMYMILASQFESFLHPVTIMLSLPLSIPFAMLSLVVTGNSLNIFSALGVFMLFGIVKKNAILQIDYTNTLRAKGIPRDEAILKANHARFRPILMTTITLVAGMIPMALGTGAGSATRSAMAIVIIGGQSLCLFITLLLTPVAYSLFDDIVEWVNGKMPKLSQ